MTVADVAATTKELDVTTYYAAGMAVFFLFFTVQFGVASLLEERKEGTLSRLLAAPIGRGRDPGRQAAHELRARRAVDDHAHRGDLAAARRASGGARSASRSSSSPGCWPRSA